MTILDLSALHRTINGLTTPLRVSPSLLFRKTVILALPFILIVGIAVYGYYNTQVTTVTDNAQRINQYANDDLYLTLKQLLRNIKGDARLLARHPLLPDVLRNPQSAAATLLEKLWQGFSSQKRIYDQIRLLDKNGMELLRINLGTDSANIVPAEKLQNKATRYYFREAMTLPVGEIYISPLDLNVENGEIEHPIKPMLRIAVPVADKNGDKAGLIILNYLAEEIIENIRAHSVLVDSNTLLLNRQGYYLHGMEPEQEWLFMYPERPQKSGLFATRYPVIWHQIFASGQGDFSGEQGLVSFRWVGTNEDHNEPTAFTRRFALVSIITAEHLSEMLAPYRRAALAALLLALPTILIIAAIASRFRLREQNIFDRLCATEANQRLILESVGEGIIGLDDEGRLTFANTRAAELTGYRQSEMLGRPAHKILHTCNANPESHLADTCALQQSISNGISRHTDNDVFLRRNCEEFPVEYISNPIIEDGKIKGGVVSFFDITARKKAEQHIEYLALNDPLTDLPNKSLLLDRLNQQLAAARHSGQMGTLFYIDIDRFKQLNDGLGHNNGDEILIETARRLKSIVQEGDTVARISSDEFVLLRANDDIGAEHMAHIAQLNADELMLILEQPYRLEHENVRITASIGIAIFPMADEDADTILSQADTAVSSAKEAGRHATRFFETEMENTTRNWLTIHNRMLEALSAEAFTLVYQPKVTPDGNIIGLEALLRWHDEELGDVSPADFVPVAEQSGLIAQLSEFVLATACGQVKMWCDEGLGETFGHIAINISPAQFSEKNFVDYVLGYIWRSGISASDLELEITERTLIDDISDTRDKVLALRAQGVRFSIDDFGTGYSSLAYLQQLPLDRLKIDRAFVSGVDSNSDQQTIVEAIILLAQGLGIAVIAEGVESAAELEYLLQAGCHEFQGYHFHRPMGTAELTELLRQRAAASENPGK